MDFVKGSREAALVAQAVLSAPCLTVSASDGLPVRGLFDEIKLKEESQKSNAPSCIEYSQGIYINIYGYGNNIKIGDSDLGTIKAVKYPAAIKKEDGSVTSAKMLVYVEAANECTKKDEYVCITGKFGNEYIAGNQWTGSGQIYMGKCIEKDGVLIIDRDSVKNCKTDYFASASLIKKMYKEGGLSSDEPEYNVCACGYVGEKAMCLYPYHEVDFSTQCTAVD